MNDDLLEIPLGKKSLLLPQFSLCTELFLNIFNFVKTFFHPPILSKEGKVTVTCVKTSEKQNIFTSHLIKSKLMQILKHFSDCFSLLLKLDNLFQTFYFDFDF